MAISATDRNGIIELIVGMFGAAPGNSVLTEMVAAFEGGASLAQIAVSLEATAEFRGMYPTFLTSEEFATNLVENLTGTDLAAADKTWAVEQLVTALNAGQSRASVAYDAITALSAVPETEPSFGAAAARLNNQVEVATYYTVEKLLSGSSLAELQAVIADVTSSDATVTAAKAFIDNQVDKGENFVLTAAIDTLTGTNGNDTFVADAATISSADTIVGGLGTDTLTYTDASANGQTINANVSGVEIINIRNINGTAAKAAVTETQTVSIGGAATGAVTFLGVAVATSANLDTAAQTATKIVADKANIIAGGIAGAAGLTDISASGSTLTLTFGTFDAAVIATATSNGITFGASIEATKGSAAVAAAGTTDTVAAGSFSGATNFNSTASSSDVSFTGLAAGQEVAKVGGSGALSAGFATGVAPVVNLKDGTSTGAVTVTGGSSAITVNSTGSANNSAGTFTVPVTAASLTVNAEKNFTATSLVGMAANSSITASGAGSVSFGTTTAIPANVATISGAGLTGGITAKLNNNAIAVTGGNGADTFSLNVNTLTTGSVNAGTGSDTLIMETADVATLAQGNKVSGFETVRVIASSTQNFDLLATNNTFTSVQMQGVATLTNVPASVASFVALAGGAISIGIKGALTPGQIDTVTLVSTNALSSVATHTFAAPALAGVEILNISNSENTTIGALTAALALTNINASGGATAPLSITTGAIALQTNFAVNAASLAGNFVFDATGATTNGFSVTGGSGTNTITGGNQIFSANLSASAAKADVVTVSNATGGTTELANATVTGFVSNADVTIGDKIEVIGAAAIPANAAANTATGIAGITAQLTSGIITFSGATLASVTLAQKLTAATAAGLADAANDIVAFVHGGDTYLVSNQGTDNTFDAGTDIVVKLVGVTDLVALNTVASAASTAFVG